MRDRRQGSEQSIVPKRRHGLFVALPPCATLRRLSQGNVVEGVAISGLRRHRLASLSETLSRNRSSTASAGRRRPGARVFGHEAFLDGVEQTFSRVWQTSQFLVVVELGAVARPSSQAKIEAIEFGSKFPCPSDARGNAASRCHGQLRLPRPGRRASHTRSSAERARRPAPPCRIARRRRSSLQARHSAGPFQGRGHHVVPINGVRRSGACFEILLESSHRLLEDVLKRHHRLS